MKEHKPTRLDKIPPRCKLIKLPRKPLPPRQKWAYDTPRAAGHGCMMRGPNGTMLPVYRKEY